MVLSADSLLSPLLSVTRVVPVVLGGHPSQRTLTTTTSLCMAKFKNRGGLAFIAQEGDGLAGSSTAPRKTAPPKKKVAKSRGTSASDASPISPDLLKFMETKELTATENGNVSTEVEAVDVSQQNRNESNEPSFVPFASDAAATPLSRRDKQNIRQQLEETRATAVSAAVTQIESVIATGGNTMLAELLPLLGQLEEMSSSSSSLKQLLSTKKRLDYRLAWVGSDTAVSHTGTGLHKVALARLQEVFLTLTGKKSRVQYTEVIRILGPFPNVKNTLQGSSSSSSVLVSSTGGETETWKIVWDSMIDGTGKELLAGKAENTQTVLLNVCFSDEQVLLATLPGKSLNDDNGQHALLFIRETLMDDKLESLRVA